MTELYFYALLPRLATPTGFALGRTATLPVRLPLHNLCPGDSVKLHHDPRIGVATEPRWKRGPGPQSPDGRTGSIRVMVGRAG